MNEFLVRLLVVLSTTRQNSTEEFFPEKSLGGILQWHLGTTALDELPHQDVRTAMFSSPRLGIESNPCPDSMYRTVPQKATIRILGRSSRRMSRDLPPWPPRSILSLCQSPDFQRNGAIVFPNSMGCFYFLCLFGKGRVRCETAFPLQDMTAHLFL